MKGMLLPFATTLAVVLIGVALAIGGVFIYATLVISGSEVDNRFEFASLLTRPYDIAIILSQSQLDKRTFNERSLETSLSMQQQGDFDDVSYFIEKYDIQYFFMKIYTDERFAQENDAVVFTMDNLLNKCGADENSDGQPDGTCVSKKIGTMRAGPCGVGRIEILDIDMCGSSYVCCKEDLLAYLEKPKPYDIVPCGENNIGYCDALTPHIFAMFGAKTKKCGEGRLRLESGEAACIDTNEGMTPVCCAPLTEVVQTSTKLSSTAEFPLLYKGKTLYEPKNFECHDNTEQCSGEYVQNLCIYQPANVRCCVTEEIHCKPPHEDYVCMNFDHCTGTIVEGADGDKLCPGPSNYVCCNTNKHYKETANGEQQESKGSCTLGDEAYSGEPFQGSVMLTVAGPLTINP